MCIYVCMMIQIYSYFGIKAGEFLLTSNFQRHFERYSLETSLFISGNTYLHLFFHNVDIWNKIPE